MKQEVLIFSIMSIIALVFNTIGELKNKERKKYANIGFLLHLAAGIYLCCDIMNNRNNVGYYQYSINGIKTSSTVVDGALAIIIGVVIGLLSCAITTKIAEMIAKKVRH